MTVHEHGYLSPLLESKGTASNDMLILIADQVAKLQDVQTLLYERQHTHEAEALLQQLNQVREANNLPPLTLTPLGVNPTCSNDQRISTKLFVAKGVLTFVWDR